MQDVNNLEVLRMQALGLTDCRQADHAVSLTIDKKKTLTTL